MAARHHAAKTVAQLRCLRRPFSQGVQLQPGESSRLFCKCKLSDKGLEPAERVVTSGDLAQPVQCTADLPVPSLRIVVKLKFRAVRPAV